MTAYYIDEGVFELPEGAPYVDRSINVIEIPGDKSAELGLHIERKAIEEGKSLADIRVEQRQEHEKKLRGFTLLSEDAVEVGGLPALSLRLRWRHPKGPVYHYQVYVRIEDTCLIMTASSRNERAETCDAWMSQLLETMRFRPR